MQEKPPVWDRLKNMCCPKCNASLTEEANGYRCSKEIWDGKCKFFITRAKFDATVASLYAPKRRGFFPGDAGDDNASELNNLDTGNRRSTFEDMPTRGED